MKKLLLLLPIAGLLLTGCGDKKEDNSANPEENGALPGGGTEVDINNEANIASISNRLATNLKISYDALKTGVEINGSIKANSINIVDPDYTCKVSNTGFDYSIKVANLDKTINEWQAAVKISNFHGYSIANENDYRKKEFSASNMNFAAYLSEGKVYTDLSDENLPTLVDNILEYCLGVEDGKNIEKIVHQFFGKHCRGNITDIAEVPDTFGLPVLNDAVFSIVKNEIASFMSEMVGAPKIPFRFVTYSGNGLGIEADYSMKIDGADENLKGTILFSNDGKLASSSFRVIGGDKVTNLDGKVVNEFTEDVETTFSVKFGNPNIEMPNFSDYLA